MAQPARIIWGAERVSLDVPVEETIESTVTFQSDQALEGVTVSVVPELARFVSVEPSTIARVKAGTRVELRLRGSVPRGTPLGTHDGTLHVRNGHRTFAQPLPLTVKVVPDQRTWRSKATVTVEGISPETFNPRHATVRFLVRGAMLSTVPGEVLVRLNGQDVPGISVTPSEVSVALEFGEGVNRLSLQGIDGAGRLLYFATTFQAGARTLQVRVLDERGQPAAASVTLRFGDDQRISATAATAGGVATFSSLPGRTMLIDARGEANRFGHVSAHGGAGTVTLAMRAFDPPSPVDNKDFSQGTSGWIVGSLPVRIVPHVETPGGAPAGAAAPAPPVRPADREAAWRDFQEQHPPQPQALAAPTNAAEGTDYDMLVPTQGEGPQTVSHPFKVTPGAKSVVVRHRFVTSEVPGGWFGSQYNDSFSVTIRSQAGGGVATFAQTMNGLGLDAFIYQTGETREWFEARLPVDRDGDVVQVDATVSNVGDGAYDSQLIIDLIDEKHVEIGPLEGIVCGSTATVEVKVGEIAPPITLKLTSSGEGSATFSGGDTTMTITETTTVTIHGVTVSSRRNDIRLTASAGGEELDHRDFSVIWVDIEIRNGGELSQDNDAAWQWVEHMGSDQLGLVQLGAKLNYGIYVCALEIVGTVKPSDFEGRIEPRRFLLDRIEYQDQSESYKGIPGPDHNKLIVDMDPRPNGRVYDVDAPGDKAHGHTEGKVYRTRINMRQYWVYNDEPVSDEKPWFSRFSFKRLEGRVYVPVYDVPGDNDCGEGSTPTTWDLQ